VTTNNVFALYLGDTDETSFIELGSSDIDSYSSDPSQAVTLDVDSILFWEYNINEV